jgi:hypothetical protein
VQVRTDQRTEQKTDPGHRHLLREPLNKSHMSRVSGAMALDARRRGAANSSSYSQAAQQSR